MAAPTASNQITAGYYFCLKGQINNGTCSMTVVEVRRFNGSYHYSTYHLV